MWDFRTTAAMHHTVFFGLHEGILRWQKRRSKRHRMPECNSPLGWQTSFQRIPVHYHSMPSHSDDALYRCSTDSKVHWFPPRSHYCWHPPRFAGIFDETPKVKASQLQKKSLAAFIFLLYHLRWQSFLVKVLRLLFSFNFENATLFKMDSPLMFMVHSAHSVKIYRK